MKRQGGDGQARQPRPKRRISRFSFFSVAVLLMSMLSIPILQLTGNSPAGAAPPKALILDTSVTAGTATDGSGESLEQQQAEADGFTVDVVSATTWGAMTASDFAKYQVLVLGDPECGDTSSFAAAEANASVWEPVVMASGGNKVLIGTDSTLHNTGPTGVQRGDLVAKNGIAFAGAVSGATGAYVSLTCAYWFSPAATPVPLLDGLSTKGPGQFTVGGAPCTGDISVVAQSGPTAGLNHAALSNWGCSVHEFFDKFPSDYTPLAIAIDPVVPKTYAATDVDTGLPVSGSPYMMVSGGGIVVTSNITLSPKTATNPVGTSHTVTATVVKGTSPAAGKVVSFSVDSGPNVGKTGTATTNASGVATFTYTDTGGAGTDSISGSFIDDAGALEKDTATKTWAAGPPPNGPPVVNAGPDVTTAPNTAVALNGSASDPENDPLTLKWTVSGSGCVITPDTAAVASVTCTTPGTYTATLTASDGINPPVSDSATVTVTSPVTDKTPPVCALVSASSSGISVRVADSGSGLATVNATKTKNATTSIPAFTPGTTSDVIVTASKIKLGEGASVEFTATDKAGNVTICDPVTATLSSGQSHVFSGVPAAEHYLTISEAAGVSAVAVDVNGVTSVIWNPDGQTVDLGALGASNTISIRVLGAAGSSAAVMIWDGQ